MLTIEWSANPKAPTLLGTYGWLPGLVDRAQVLLETSYNLGCGFQEVILCSNSHCTLIAQSRVSPPVRNRARSDPQRDLLLLQECITRRWNSMNKSTEHTNIIKDKENTMNMRDAYVIFIYVWKHIWNILYVYAYICIYIYIYIIWLIFDVYIYIYVYMCIFIEREREESM